MRMRLLLTGALFTLAAASSAAWGWGGEGHQVVALIAEPRLEAAAKAEINALLGPDASISDAEIVNWADQIRDERRETTRYHYVNIPVDAAGYDAARDGRDGENLIDKLAHFEAVLKDRGKPREERQEALKWVVHLVGDLHQPLHCADREKDRGGNARLAFLLDAKGKASNLHSIWDTGIPRLMLRGTRVQEYARTITARVKPAAAKAMAGGTVVDWANGSHALAVRYVYAGVTTNPEVIPRLDQRYVDRARPVIDEQWVRAGIRLATILNRCFPPRR